MSIDTLLATIRTKLVLTLGSNDNKETLELIRSLEDLQTMIKTMTHLDTGVVIFGK